MRPAWCLLGAGMAVTPFGQPWVVAVVAPEVEPYSFAAAVTPAAARPAVEPFAAVGAAGLVLAPGPELEPAPEPALVLEPGPVLGPEPEPGSAPAVVVAAA